MMKTSDNIMIVRKIRRQGYPQEYYTAVSSNHMLLRRKSTSSKGQCRVGLEYLPMSSTTLLLHAQRKRPDAFNANCEDIRQIKWMMIVATQQPETVMHEPHPNFATEEESFNHQLEHPSEGSLVSALVMESIMVEMAE